MKVGMASRNSLETKSLAHLVSPGPDHLLASSLLKGRQKPLDVTGINRTHLNEDHAFQA
jgi:hypothetical protein